MDARDRANGYPKNFNKDRMCFTHWMEIDTGSPEECEETQVEFPAVMEVCSLCDGKGTHVSPGIDSNGLTHEELYEDPEFARDYFQGTYDVPCHACKGQNVFPQYDWDRMTPEQRKFMEDWWDSEAEMRAMEEAERRAGC